LSAQLARAFLAGLGVNGAVQNNLAGFKCIHGNDGRLQIVGFGKFVQFPLFCHGRNRGSK
jgi:hypothetical protein